MMNVIQKELFSEVDYTFLCRNCRRGFPRSIEFFPKGKCKDKLASYCRKCSNSIEKKHFPLDKVMVKKRQYFSQEKICEECGIIKQLRDFYMSSHSIDGKTIACKKCIDEIHSERKVRQKCFSGFTWVVYFVQDSINKRVKIGSSEDPEQTLSDLQEGSSEKLFLLAVHDSGEKYNAETSVKTLFSFFKSHHKGNGWFEFVPSLEQYIYLLKNNDKGAIRLLYPEDINKKTLYKD